MEVWSSGLRGLGSSLRVGLEPLLDNQVDEAARWTLKTTWDTLRVVRRRLIDIGEQPGTSQEVSGNDMLLNRSKQKVFQSRIPT